MGMNELEKTFKNYVDFVGRNLKVQSPEKSKSTSKVIFLLFSNRDREIREKVEQLTQGKEFSELVKSTIAEFQGMADVIRISHYSYFNTEFFLGHDYYLRAGVQNFFCKTGFYQKVVNGINLNTKDLYDLFCAAFQKEKAKTLYLAPMKEVGFSDPNMNYGDFRIGKFTKIELENIFNNETNRIFYPEAFFDTTILLDYWFITVEDSETLANQVHEFFQYPLRVLFPQNTHFFQRNLKTLYVQYSYMIGSLVSAVMKSPMKWISSQYHLF